MNRHILRVDGFMIRFFGLAYLRLTRHLAIHERCNYLAQVVYRLHKSGLNILDVGCGAGVALYYLERFCRSMIHSYVGIDMNIERLPKRWGFVRTPHCFRRIDLDDDWELGLFDLIWCSEVIEHIVDDERLFYTMARHLAPYGLLVITTPNLAFVERIAQMLPDFGRISCIQDGGHVRKGYELEEIEKMARANNLAVVRHDWLSPCSEAQVRTIYRGAVVRNFAQVLMNVIARPASSSGSIDRCGENCLSLAVSMARVTEPSA